MGAPAGAGAPSLPSGADARAEPERKTNFSVTVARLLSAFAFLLRARKTWRRPARATVLIFDRDGSDDLLEYIDPAHAAILDVRGESLNVFVLLKCVLTFRFSLQSYIREYVATVRPAVAITFIDNNSRFYGLKDAHEELVTVFVQNGWRGEVGDVFGLLKDERPAGRYSVD